MRSMTKGEVSKIEILTYKNRCILQDVGCICFVCYLDRVMLL